MYRFRQYYSVFCANLMTMGYGVLIAWVSPTIPLWLSDETPLKSYGKLTKDEVSWISAFICIGNIVGCLIGVIADRYGRKAALYSTVIPLIVNWLMIYFATTSIELMIARFFAGLVGACPLMIIPMYITEIAEDEIRGTLGSYVQFALYTGSVIGYACGGYLNYYFTSLMSLLFPILFTIGFIFVPETPAYLASKNKIIEAEKSLKFYRGYSKNSVDFSVSFIKELEKLKKTEMSQTPETSTLCLSDFTNKAARKAISLGVTISIASRIGGIYALIVYIGVIFLETGSSISSNLSTIIVSIIFLCGTFCSIKLVDRAGRKILFVLSTLLTGLCELILGIYLYLKSCGIDVSNFGWIPLACMTGLFFSSSWGLTPLPLIILNETLPIKIRSTVGMFCRLLISVIGFLLLKYFYIAIDTIHLYGCMWAFSATCFIAVFISIIYLPETKGKPLEEILESLRK